MKRLLLSLVLLLLLCGCSRMRQNDYLVVESHSEQPTEPTQPTTEEDILRAQNRTELRNRVISLVRGWKEQGEILVKDYDGDLAADLNEALLYATQEDPIGAYAVDFADAELFGDKTEGFIRVSIVFRRSAGEIDSIIITQNNQEAWQKITEALHSYSPSLTLRIRDYQEVDHAALIREYCLEHPEQIVAIPELSAEVYPKEGSTRILELHFSYPESRESMREKALSVQSHLESLTTHVQLGKDASAQLERIFEVLTFRAVYQLSDTELPMPVYELLQKRVAHSLSFAAVFRYLCRSVGIRCELVFGERNSVPHYWNLVELDGSYYHVDLFRSEELGEILLTPLYDEDLLFYGYTWDSSSYHTAPRPAELDPTTSEPSSTPETNPDIPETSATTESEPESQPSTESTEEESSSAEETHTP